MLTLDIDIKLLIMAKICVYKQTLAVLLISSFNGVLFSYYSDHIYSTLDYIIFFALQY